MDPAFATERPERAERALIPAFDLLTPSAYSPKRRPGIVGLPASPGSSLTLSGAAVAASGRWRLRQTCTPSLTNAPYSSRALAGRRRISAGRWLTCRSCGVGFFVCDTCFRGQAYCGAECALQGRRTSARRASKTFQQGRRGKSLHASRQARYRSAKVTRQRERRAWRLRASRRARYRGSKVTLQRGRRTRRLRARRRVRHHSSKVTHHTSAAPAPAVVPPHENSNAPKAPHPVPRATPKSGPSPRSSA